MRLLALFVLSVAVAPGAFSEPQATFETVGTPYSYAQEVSADGAVVVGVMATPGSDGTAFRWTSEGGMMPFLPNGGALGASADGSVVVGERDSLPPVQAEAFRWTASSGAIGLGVLPGDADSVAFDTSADGSVVVGYSIQSQSAGWRATAFRWTQAGGMVPLGAAPGGAESLARGVSADGSVVVGELRGTGGSSAFRWTADVGIVDLGTLPNATRSFATDVSADGSVVVGSTGAGYSGGRAFRWSAERGMQELPFADAYSVSADGSVVVGRASDGSAMIWTPSGARLLLDLLRDYGVSPSRLDRATGVSDDGLVIVGWGAQGAQSWRVSLAVAECGNGLDDDGDGIADFPDDLGCTGASDLSERGTLACDNGFDEDGDGIADFPEDPGCESLVDDSEVSSMQCDNGLDDDFDGKVDWHSDGSGDPGCSSLVDDSEDTTQCMDGVDNDEDGRIDLADPDCAGRNDDSEYLIFDGTGWRCGLGPELGLLLPALWWLRHNRSLRGLRT